MSEDEEEEEMEQVSETLVKEVAKKKLKTDNKCRNWAFTLNNYADGDVAFLEDLKCTYVVFGKEVGADGTAHLQGQVVFPNVLTMAGVKTRLGPRYHVEMTRDLPKSIEYCKKDGEFHEHGVKPMAPAEKGDAERDRWQHIWDCAIAADYNAVDPRTRLLYFKQMEAAHLREIKAGVKDTTLERNVWYVGGTGSGKSRKARDENPDAYVKMINKWWDGYEMNDVVIVDDIDPSSCEKMGHLFKTWTDHYAFTCEIKGAVTRIRPKRFVITSNFTIEECFPNAKDAEAMNRRFDTYQFQLGREPVKVEPPSADEIMMNAAKNYFNKN